MKFHRIERVRSQAKPGKATARNLRVPAINNRGGFGRWAFIEITDPWDAKNSIRASLRTGRAS